MTQARIPKYTEKLSDIMLLKPSKICKVTITENELRCFITADYYTKEDQEDAYYFTYDKVTKGNEIYFPSTIAGEMTRVIHRKLDGQLEDFNLMLSKDEESGIYTVIEMQTLDVIQYPFSHL